MTPHTIAVIGHVDHGKTSLVKALTGTVTDTLAEEQSRGLSIVPGFAFADFGAARLNFIDTPGHEDFIRRAVAAMSGASAVLLVVSATEGIKQQTREHIQIAELLGIREALMAVTKSDLATDDERLNISLSIQSFLKETAFSQAPIVYSDTMTPQGTESLQDALATWARTAPAPLKRKSAILPIDRVFSAGGIGTVVAGTLLGAPLNIGDHLQLLPGGVDASIRGLQENGVDAERAKPGARVAINLRGIAQDEVKRGDVLCHKGALKSTHWTDATITPLGHEQNRLKHMQKVQVLAGTSYATATVRLLPGKQAKPKDTIFAQLQFAGPQVFYAGQHFIIRQLSPPRTLGGGRILDPASTLARKNKLAYVEVLKAAHLGALELLARRMAERDGGAAAKAELERLLPGATGALPSEGFLETKNGYFILGEASTRLASDYVQALNDLYTAHPLRVGFNQAQVTKPFAKTHPALLQYTEDELLADGSVRIQNGVVSLAGHDPFALMTTRQKDRYDTLETELQANGLNAMRLEPASPPTEDDELIALLIAFGRAIALYNHALKQNLVFHVSVIETARLSLAGNFAGDQIFSTGEARAALKTNRRIIVPLLEHFDATGLTSRDGDQRRIMPKT